MLSSHVKISPLLWLHNKSHLSHQKTIDVKWLGISLVFIIIINRTLHGCLENYEISLLVLKKYFTHTLHSLVKYFSTLEEKFGISAGPCNILHLLHQVHHSTSLVHHIEALLYFAMCTCKT